MRIDSWNPYAPYHNGYRRDETWLELENEHYTQALATVQELRTNETIPHPLLQVNGDHIPFEGTPEERLLMRQMLTRPTTLAALIWPLSVQIKGFEYPSDRTEERVLKRQGTSLSGMLYLPDQQDTLHPPHELHTST